MLGKNYGKRFCEIAGKKKTHNVEFAGFGTPRTTRSIRVIEKTTGITFAVPVDRACAERTFSKLQIIEN